MSTCPPTLSHDRFIVLQHITLYNIRIFFPNSRIFFEHSSVPREHTEPRKMGSIVGLYATEISPVYAEQSGDR